MLQAKVWDVASTTRRSRLKLGWVIFFLLLLGGSALASMLLLIGQAL
ncbi:hypothetical protein NMD97_15390 [Edwardsiella tarda]